MADQQIEKRRLEENLGLNRDDVVQSGFDEEIVLDLVNKKYESLREHPLVAQDRRAWPDWVFFLVIHEGNAQIWAIDQRHLKTVHMTNQDYLTHYDVRKCLKPDSIIHRFYVTRLDDDDDRYYVRTNQLNKDQAEFDDCLYVGTLHLSLRGIKGIMAMIARENYLLLQTNCSGFCKNFVMIYFDMKEKTLAAEHVMRLETFLARIEQSEQKPSSDWSLLSSIISAVWPFAQAYAATVLGVITAYGILIYRGTLK